MTASWRRGRRHPQRTGWWSSALTTAFALVGLVVISGAPGTPRLALRADTYNQMTGIGATASAIVVNWTSGLLNSSNQPITGSSSTDGGTELNPNADRAAGTGSLSFMDSDFANLRVTVSQTENITHQGVTVSWTGANPSDFGNPASNFMQIMECYGDSASGPSPEGCEYGSPGMLGSTNNQVTARTGFTCSANAVPSTSSPPSGPEAGAAMGCDANEPAAETPAHCDPNATGLATCSSGEFSVPFVPVDDPTNPLYGAGASGTGTGTVFNRFTTNEVQAAYTAADKTGQQQFETLTQTEAPGLGCGARESNGRTRDCWLVIVPRGNYEPNGFKASNSVPLDTSPLSAGNWAQRIQIHLGYTPLTANCPPTVVPELMAGTQVVSRAVTSWESALNQAANCTKVYSYTATPETEATTELQSPGNGNAGLAFTTIPIGSEVTRQGERAPTLPKILYAPVAVTAIDAGFNINITGQDGTPVNLTPSLLARALTQVYQSDLPDYAPAYNSPGPAWVKNNPYNMVSDPAFHSLNTVVPQTFAPGQPLAPLITGDHTADNQRIWQWIQSNPATASWLDGATNASNPVTADPADVALKLGRSPATDQFDEAYQGNLTCALADSGNTSCGDPNWHTGSPPPYSLDDEDILPVEANYDQAAAAVLAANDPAFTKQWNSQNKAPDGSQFYWSTVGPEIPGQTFMWALNDMPDLAAYGLVSAALCDSAGAHCTQPSIASVTAALNSAKPDSAGLLQVNPAKVPSGAYPLVDVVYAAVPTNQSGSVLTDYANFISYAAGQGQTTGTASGDLPPGYLPLTASLQAQAKSVVTKLKALAVGTASPSASPTSATSSPSGTHQSTTGGSTTDGGSATGTGGTSTGNVTATTPGTRSATSICTAAASSSTACASRSATPQPFSVLPASAQAAAGTTQSTQVGAVRIVLIIVLIIGAAGALAGGLLRYGRVPARGQRSRERRDGT